MADDMGWKSKLKIPPKDRRKKTTVRLFQLIFLCNLLIQKVTF